MVLSIYLSTTLGILASVCAGQGRFGGQNGRRDVDHGGGADSSKSSTPYWPTPTSNLSSTLDASSCSPSTVYVTHTQDIWKTTTKTETCYETTTDTTTDITTETSTETTTDTTTTTCTETTTEIDTTTASTTISYE